MADLSDFITSQSRRSILKLLASDPTQMYHIRGIVRETGEEINSIRRELQRMEEAGMVRQEKRGNRIYYEMRQDYLFFGDILAMVAKTTGLGAQILENRAKLGKLLYVMFSGKFARNKERKRDDEVDILVVGDVNLPELANIIRIEESKRNYEINYAPMSRDELEFRKKRKDPFLQGIFMQSRVMILGDEETLVG